MTTILTTQPIVTPAKAGAHHLTIRFELTWREMDSRLRGNDEDMGVINFSSRLRAFGPSGEQKFMSPEAPKTRRKEGAST